MNKGLAIHIIVTIVYALLVLFIIDGERIEIKHRVNIVLAGLVVNLITCIVCSDNEYYNDTIY